jgi:hypothetical protein
LSDEATAEIERLKRALNKLDRKMHKLENLVSAGKLAQYDARRALFYALACIEFGDLLVDKAVKHVEGVLNGD